MSRDKAYHLLEHEDNQCVVLEIQRDRSPEESVRDFWGKTGLERSSLKNGKDFNERNSFNLGAFVWSWECFGKGFLVAKDLLHQAGRAHQSSWTWSLPGGVRDFFPTPPLTLTGWLPRDDAFQFIIPGTSGGGREGPHCAIG